MTKKGGTKYKKVDLRITDDMDEWVGEQAALYDIGKSTWIRLQLAQLREKQRREAVETYHNTVSEAPDDNTERKAAQ